jgi:hypothetical protein
MAHCAGGVDSPSAPRPTGRTAGFRRAYRKGGPLLRGLPSRSSRRTVASRSGGLACRAEAPGGRWQAGAADWPAEPKLPEESSMPDGSEGWRPRGECGKGGRASPAHRSRAVWIAPRRACAGPNPVTPTSFQAAEYTGGNKEHPAPARCCVRHRSGSVQGGPRQVSTPCSGLPSTPGRPFCNRQGVETRQRARRHA